MLDITQITEVNFYGDVLHLVEGTDTDTGETVPCVSVAEITENLSVSNFDRFLDDERVDVFNTDSGYMVPVRHLPAMLMLIGKDEVIPEKWGELLVYQRECGDALYNYWIHGVAVNGRETPYDVRSKFKDFRVSSRPALIEACKEYATATGNDPDTVFNKVLANCYEIARLKPLHEYEALNGTQATFLASIEVRYANTLRHCVAWGKNPEDMAVEDVRAYAQTVGQMWLRLADDIPPALFT
jgi:hypothetical protein